MKADSSRTLVASGYLLATVMATMTVFDLAMRLRPFRTGDVMWRIGAVGMVSLDLATLLLALLILCLTAHQLDHRRVLRTCAVLCAVSAAVTLIVVPLFALDVLQLRKLVAPEARLTIDLTMGRAALAALLTCLALAWIAVGGWTATAHPREKRANSPGSDVGAPPVARRLNTAAAPRPGGSERITTNIGST